MAHENVLTALGAETGDLLSGAVFEIRSASLAAPLTVTTGDDGRGTADIAPGRYDIHSITPPAGYAPADSLVRTADVGADAPAVEFRFPRQAKLRVEVVSCVDASALRPVPNATVIVRRNSGAVPSASGITGADGWAVFDRDPGIYRVEHPIAPTGYILGDGQTEDIILAPGATVERRFTDVPMGSLVVRVRDGENQPVPGAWVLVCRDTEPKRQAKTGDDGTLHLDLPGGRYVVTLTGPAAAGHVLADEAARTKDAVVGPGDPASLELTSPRAGTVAVKALQKDVPSTPVPGGTYAVHSKDNKTTRTLVAATDGTALADGLAADTYTVLEAKSPPGYKLASDPPPEVVLAAGASQTVTFEYAPTASSNKNIGFLAAWFIIALFLVWAVLAAVKGNWDQVSAALVVAVGLVLLNLTGGTRYGFFRGLIGDDNRVSTSKTQLGIWTVAVVWGMAFLTAHAVFHTPSVSEKASCIRNTKADANSELSISQRVQCALPESRWSDYLILLGGPFAAAVLAKGFVTTRVNNGTLQKTTVDADGQRQALDIVKDDQNRTDLVDSQYLLFNVVALAYFAAALAHTPELPEMPAALLAMTSGAAALYSANKAVASNKPAITGVSPATIRPGDQVSITGQNFKLTNDSTESVKVDLEGFGPLQVAADATANAVTVTVPAGVAVGQHNLTVTTNGGVTTAGWPVQVAADQPQILGVQENEAIPGVALHLSGRRFRSPLESAASNATVWFGTQMVLGELSAPTATGLDILTVDVPAILSGSQVSLQVQSTQGVRSDPVTVPLLAGARVVSLDSHALGDDKVSVQVRVRGFTDPTGQRTASNQVRVGDSPVDNFTVTGQGDREDLVTFEVARPTGSTLTIELRDHQGRSTGALSAPII